MSAPVFQKVMEGSLRLMDVPPDDIETWIAAQEKIEAKRRPLVAAVAAPAQPALPVPLSEDAP